MSNISDAVVDNDIVIKFYPILVFTLSGDAGDDDDSRDDDYDDQPVIEHFIKFSPIPICVFSPLPSYDAETNLKFKQKRMS